MYSKYFSKKAKCTDRMHLQRKDSGKIVADQIKSHLLLEKNCNDQIAQALDPTIRRSQATYEKEWLLALHSGKDCAVNTKKLDAGTDFIKKNVSISIYAARNTSNCFQYSLWKITPLHILELTYKKSVRVLKEANAEELERFLKKLELDESHLIVYTHSQKSFQLAKFAKIDQIFVLKLDRGIRTIGPTNSYSFKLFRYLSALCKSYLTIELFKTIKEKYLIAERIIICAGKRYFQSNIIKIFIEITEVISKFLPESKLRKIPLELAKTFNSKFNL